MPMEDTVSLEDFIVEQEQWLTGWLSSLGWTRSNFEERGPLIRCPMNSLHYVPESALRDHVRKCSCALLLKTNIGNLQEEDVNGGGTFLYEKTCAEIIKIDQRIKKAVQKLAKDQPTLGDSSSCSQNFKASDESSASLESLSSSPKNIHDQPKEKVIGYIKSWKIVPQDFVILKVTSLDTQKVKGWLFKNIPEKHAHSSHLGGEMSLVDSIMTSLQSLSSSPHLSLTPDGLMNSLRPLLGLGTRDLVLSLWKFLHVCKVQEESGMSNGAVSEIVAMAGSSLEEWSTGDGGGKAQQRGPSIVKLVQHNIETCQSTSELADINEELKLLSVSERRILYDYVVEVTSQQAFMKLDPELYRDDMADIKAQLKAQGKAEAAARREEEPDTSGKTYLQLLKEKRDYKRRRQKYRAKNVHITRKTPTEIFRTIIKNRMEEMRVAAQEDGSGEDESRERKHRSLSRDRSHPSELSSSQEKHCKDRSEEKTRSHDRTWSRRRERSRSRGRSKERRSRSRERKHKHHKKEKKHDHKHRS